MNTQMPPSAIRQRISEATDDLMALTADRRAYAKKEAEIADLEQQLGRAEKAQERARKLARPSGRNEPGQTSGGTDHRHMAIDDDDDAPCTLSSLMREMRAAVGARKAAFHEALSIARRGLSVPVDRETHFLSLGEQLQAVYHHAISKGANLDARLVRAPSGAGEVDPTGGGFLVQTDFQAAIFMIAHDMGELLSRVNTIPISSKSNGLKIPCVDETSRATGARWGGVRSDWASEGSVGPGGPETNRPRFRMIEFDLKKLISKMTLTNELLQDSNALTSVASQAFAEEVMFMTEDAIVEGTGAGTPLGYMNSPALIIVPKEFGQVGTILKENIDKMWGRCWVRCLDSAVWLCNQELFPQLNSLNQVIGLAGQLVFKPPGGMSAEPYGKIFGRPVITVEYCSALGTPGDLALVDLSQYTIVDKGGVQLATSMHVAFDTDEMRFRITYRVDGKPMWHQPMTPFKGGLTKSPFVVLAQR